MEPVSKYLDRTEMMGVISLMDWCTRMVAVEKDGQVCICVDLTPLNESVKRELHSLQVVEYILV